jgi:carbon starvation protein
MHAFPIMLGVLCTLAIAYRYYSAFLAAKVATLDDSRRTPAHEFEDGQNFHPTNKWVLFGHHFAAISGAGPLIGPVLAAQFGYLPGLLWLLIGVCLAGAAQDFLILAASIRHKGRSLALIAREEIGPVSGAAGIAAILFITVVALAGLGSVVVKALSGEEVALKPGTRVVLPAEQTAARTESDEDVRLPAGTHLRMSATVVFEDGSKNSVNKEFPLSFSQNLHWTSQADHDRLLAAPPGGEVAIEKPAKLLIPGSSWGIFTIGTSIPIALLMGLWMYVIRKNSPRRILEASIIGVVLLLACVQIGHYVPGTQLGAWLNLSSKQVVIAMGIYGFIASVLPVWLLLCPRDYLSSYLKIGTIAALILGVLIVNPKLEMPHYVNVWADTGPTRGAIFPFLFITIMCGSISGFHALVSSGTTPKMVNKESDARMIGYGAMLMEGLVGIVALIAACSLSPADYYAIQIPMEDQAQASLRVSKIARPEQTEKQNVIDGDLDNLQSYEVNVGENLRGRKGGAVTLAVGMSKIFGGFSFFEKLVGYWYHFAIMFEALFILTTIDTGTRIGRFLVQEIMGKIKPEFGRVDWWPGAIFSTALIVACWAGLLWNNDVGSIWGMFGIANQLLALVALSVATTVMINAGKARYALVTILPLAFCTCTTMTAGYQMLFSPTRRGYWLQVVDSDYKWGNPFLNAILVVVMLSCVVLVLVDSVRVWLKPRIGSAEVPAVAGE